MTTNVSRKINLNSFAKSTSNEIINGYIKKLYQNMPACPTGLNNNGSDQCNFLQQGVNMQKGLEKTYLMSKRPIKNKIKASVPCLLKEASTLATQRPLEKSPMAKFFSSRRYNSSASISSTSIVSKRFGMKPRKYSSAFRTNKADSRLFTDKDYEKYSKSAGEVSRNEQRSSNNYGTFRMNPMKCNFKSDLMSVDSTVKQLVSLGPQRSGIDFSSRKGLDPLTGWNHPPDINIFTNIPKISGRGSHKTPNYLKEKTAAKLMWPGMSKELNPLKKPNKRFDDSKKPGQQRSVHLNQSLKTRLNYENTEVLKQEQKLLNQKSAMLQKNLLTHKESKHAQLKPNKYVTNVKQQPEIHLQTKHKSQPQLKIKPSTKPKGKLLAQKKPQALSQDAKSLSAVTESSKDLHFNLQPSPLNLKLLSSCVLATGPMRPSLQDLFLCSGNADLLHQQHERLQNQYHKNYFNQILEFKQKQLAHDMPNKQQQDRKSSKVDLKPTKSTNFEHTTTTNNPPSSVTNENNDLRCTDSRINNLEAQNQSYAKAIQAAYAEISENSLENFVKKYSDTFLSPNFRKF